MLQGPGGSGCSPPPITPCGSWQLGLGEKNQGLPEQRPSFFLELLSNVLKTEEFLRITGRGGGEV